MGVDFANINEKTDNRLYALLSVFFHFVICFYRLDKTRRIFDEITETEIRVLAIFDTRQDPAKSPY